jgi:hypothetical protein
MTYRGIAAATGAVMMLALLVGCSAPEPDTAEQRDCAAAASLLPELDKAQGAELPSALDKKLTDTINAGEAGQVGAMLYVLGHPDDAATYDDFRGQLISYCVNVAEWPIT